MKVSYKKIFAVALLAAVVGLSACKQEGPAEKAGNKVDAAVEQAGQKIDKATEQAGQKIDKATDQAEKKIEQAGETLSDKSKQAGVYIDDSAITTKVKAAIAGDALLKVSQITVTTTNGTVRLSGVVDSRQALDRAVEVARSVEQVQAVDNNLGVKSAN